MHFNRFPLEKENGFDCWTKQELHFNELCRNKIRNLHSASMTYCANVHRWLVFHRRRFLHTQQIRLFWVLAMTWTSIRLPFQVCWVLFRQGTTFQIITLNRRTSIHITIHFKKVSVFWVESNGSSLMTNWLFSWSNMGVAVLFSQNSNEFNKFTPNVQSDCKELSDNDGRSLDTAIKNRSLLISLNKLTNETRRI